MGINFSQYKQLHYHIYGVQKSPNILHRDQSPLRHQPSQSAVKQEQNKSSTIA